MKYAYLMDSCLNSLVPQGPFIWVTFQIGRIRTVFSIDTYMYVVTHKYIYSYLKTTSFNKEFLFLLIYISLLCEYFGKIKEKWTVGKIILFNV